MLAISSSSVQHLHISWAHLGTVTPQPQWAACSNTLLLFLRRNVFQHPAWMSLGYMCWWHHGDESHLPSLARRWDTLVEALWLLMFKELAGYLPTGKVLSRLQTGFWHLSMIVFFSPHHYSVVGNYLSWKRYLLTLRMEMKQIRPGQTGEGFRHRTNRGLPIIFWPKERSCVSPG